MRERNGLVMWFGGSPFRTTQTRYGLFGARRRAAIWHHPLPHIGVTLIEMLIVIAIIGILCRGVNQQPFGVDIARGLIPSLWELTDEY